MLIEEVTITDPLDPIFIKPEKFAKHLYGQHDQSTHAPQHRSGVPAGIDLEGKRFSSASKLELVKLIHKKEMAWYHAHDEALKASHTVTSPEESKKLYKKTLDSNQELIDAKKALSENFLYKDAMNLHDANGVRLGDKVYEDALESPSDYLMRKATVSEGILAGNVYEMPRQFYNSKLDTKLKDTRTTAEESIKIATEDFKTFASQAESVIVIPQAKLNQVLLDGRMKTVHETGQSQGASGKADEHYIDDRLLYENVAYGYNDSTPVSARPVSGLMVGKGGYPMEAHAIYGGSKPAEVVLKPETKSRTTWTDGDSLNYFQAGKTTDATIFQANTTAHKAAIYRKGTGDNYFDSKDFGYNTPFEIQVHGGVQVSDIAKVRFFTPPSKSVIARLEKQGIPYETVPLPDGEN